MLTPTQARERFGELTIRVGRTYAHQHFGDGEGFWDPVFDENMPMQGH